MLKCHQSAIKNDETIENVAFLVLSVNAFFTLRRPWASSYQLYEYCREKFYCVSYLCD
jgi:hypothetical protein